MERRESDARAPSPYLEAVTLIDRAHHRLHDVIKYELARHGRGDITVVEALLLYRLGDRELSHSQLRDLGCYHGTNASYSQKKLIEAGLLDLRRAPADRRSVRLRLTGKGREIAGIVTDLYARQERTIEKAGGVDAAGLAALSRMVRFWGDQVAYRL